MQSNQTLWRIVRIATSFGVVFSLLMALSVSVGQILTGFSNFMAGFDSGNRGTAVYQVGDTPMQSGFLYVLSFVGYLVSAKFLGATSKHMLAYGLGLLAPAPIIISALTLTTSGGLDVGGALVMALILGISAALVISTANKDLRLQAKNSTDNLNQ